MHLMPPMALDPGIVRRCAFGVDGHRGSDDDWEKCKGGAVVDVVAEGWGQGHARASALGVAGMMATLAASANGLARVPRPHLVDAIHGVAGTSADAFTTAAARWSAPATAAPPLSRDAAEVILSGLSFSHRAGTARTACEQVFDARRCREIDWLAGKTGTPSFPSDGLSLDTIVRVCRPDAPPSAEAKRGACSSLKPYKWYVAAFRADRAKSGPWTKAIAVLAERNWLRASGRIHGTGDHGPNPAAEIAIWAFDGPFERCLDDIEDSLRRAIVLIGDVSRVALLIDLSLPALQARVRAGDRIQPAWGRFVERVSGYGLPSFPRVRHLRTRGPLATLVVAYRS